MPKNKKHKKEASNDGDGDDMNDWIASLAKQSAATSEAAAPAVASKEERKRKRAAKKARREQRQEERKRPAVERSSESLEKPSHAPQQAAAASKRRLRQLTQLWQEVREHQNDQPSRRYIPDPSSTRRIKRKKPLNETNIQPRPSDYSGIGLARKSLYLALDDPAHIPKLEEEFAEHIPGFFGKQRTKAMKKQLDGNMLWRRLADQKKGGVPKKFAKLSPDDRVQAMIDAGML